MKSLATARKPSASPGDRPGVRRQARLQAQERILEAARTLFAESGFAAVSMARIAASAGFTKGLVHHYFGSKRELWERVIDRYAAKGAREEAPRRADLDAILDWVVQSFHFFRTHPEFLRIAAWAELQTDYDAPASLVDLEREFNDLFRAAHAAGAIRTDVDPLHARAMIHQMMAGWFQTKRFFCPIWKRDPDALEVDEAYLADVLTFVRAGLDPTSRSRPARAARPGPGS
jgi:TetR/AcrR family transcriptional regulator